MRSPYCIAALLVTLACAAPAQNQGIQLQNGNVDNHVDVAYQPGLVLPNGITVEAVITYDDATIPINQGYRWPTVARQDVRPHGESWFLRVGAANTGNRNLEWAVHNGTSLQFNTYVFAAGRFATPTHVACTYDGTTSAIYLDGQLVQSQAVSGRMRDNMGILRIGNGDVAVAGYEVWHGKIDELRIWCYARTQAEIASTARNELVQVPAAVTFNLNGHFLDFSSGFRGTATGTVPFVACPLLVAKNSGAVAYGPSTSACATIRSTVGSTTHLGNSAFAVVLCDAAPNASAVLFMSRGKLEPPQPVLGIQLNLDPLTLLDLTLFAAGGPNGTVRFALPIPQDPSLRGGTVFTQAVLVAATCGVPPLGLSSSNGLQLGLQ